MLRLRNPALRVIREHSVNISPQPPHQNPIIPWPLPPLFKSLPHLCSFPSPPQIFWQKTTSSHTCDFLPNYSSLAPTLDQNSLVTLWGPHGQHLALSCLSSAPTSVPGTYYVNVCWVRSKTNDLAEWPDHLFHYPLGASPQKITQRWNANIEPFPPKS